MDESCETFRIPGTGHRLIVPTMIYLLLPIGVSWPAQWIEGPAKWFPIAAAAGVAVLLIARHTWREARAVDVAPEGVRLRWALHSRWIPAAEIEDAQLVIWETIDPPEAWTSHGLHGLWDSPDLGPVEIYATEPGSMALLHLHTGPPLLLGVEFADELVEAVEADILGRSNLF